MQTFLWSSGRRHIWKLLGSTGAEFRCAMKYENMSAQRGRGKGGPVSAIRWSGWRIFLSQHCQRAGSALQKHTRAGKISYTYANLKEETSKKREVCVLTRGRRRKSVPELLYVCDWDKQQVESLGWTSKKGLKGTRLNILTSVYKRFPLCVALCSLPQAAAIPRQGNGAPSHLSDWRCPTVSVQHTKTASHTESWLTRWW